MRTLWTIGALSLALSVTFFAVDTAHAMDAGAASPEPALFAGDASMVAGASESTLTIPVTLDEPSPDPVTVRYRVIGATAVAGRDFAPQSGTLQFSATTKKKLGVVEQFVDVTVLPGSDDGGGTLSVDLFKPSSASLGNAEGTGTILEPTGSGPMFNVGDAAVYDGDASPSRSLDFSVTLSSPEPQGASVFYEVVSGTALPGYELSSYCRGSNLLYAQGDNAATEHHGLSQRLSFS